jgi:hypothetical protein
MTDVSCELRREILFDDLAQIIAESIVEKVRSKADTQSKQPPNEAAGNNAKSLLVAVWKRGLEMKETVAEADGGISFYFHWARTQGRFVLDNDGDAVVCVHSKTGKEVLEFYPTPEGIQEVLDKLSTTVS